MKTNETYRVYFTLCEDCDNECDETLGMSEVWTLLKEFSESSKLQNEGHDHDGLVCFFTVKGSRLRELHEFIGKNRGGGDDILYLPSGMQAQDFVLYDTSGPGVSRGSYFDNWDDLLDAEGSAE